MNQRLVALLTGLSMAAASALATQDSRLPLDQGAAPTSKPDFVFLLLDVMGQRGLGCGIRELMLVTRPGAVTPGSICDEPVTSTDFHPTMPGHVPQSGGHGFGLAVSNPQLAQWTTILRLWLQGLNTPRP